MVVAHNLAAMNTQRQYGIVLFDRKKSTEKLSSGYKINRAADDAAGLTISEKMRSQIRGLNQGSENIQDGISLVQIADGALAEVNDMLHRMTELSVKSANGTNTDEDRSAIQKEMQQIISEIDRIHESTEFNTMKLFDGDVDKKGDGSKLGGLVKCAAADTGKMTQDYNGRAAALLDFSPINDSNIDQLKDKSFSFRCVMGCGETFKFKFIEGDGTKSRLASDSSSMHYFEIDIAGMSSGTEIVDKIFDTVKDAADNSKIHYNGAVNSSLTYGVAVGHANGLDKVNGNTLAVYGAAGYDSRSFSGTQGVVDVTEIVGPGKELGKMKPIWIQASSSSGEDGLDIELEKMDAEYIGIDKIDVSTQNGAKDAIEKITDATSMISAMRSGLGAYQNRLEHAYANNENKAENTTAAESRIRDTDMALEMVKYTKQGILQQASEAMMAQANQSTQGVLSILG